MNTVLSPREHAHLAKSLILACGGLDECVPHCRISKSKLSDYSNPNAPLFMPADVMADLEAYCGLPIYSRALANRFNDGAAAGDLRAAACDLTEAVVQLQGRVRAAMADGVASPNELNDIAAVEREAEDMLERLRGTRRAMEASAGKLRAVS